MSVNPDMSANMGVADEFVDLEHQVIRQKVDVTDAVQVELGPGDPGAEFDPGERQLDREEVAQLVAYRRYATINFMELQGITTTSGVDNFAVCDASVGINGDLFREVTTQSTVTDPVGSQTVTIDQGGEIGLLDNYQIYAAPQGFSGSDSLGVGGIAQVSEHTINYYDYPTGGPIVDSFDTITCGFAAGKGNTTGAEVQVELRYDFWWDVAEQGRSTNPFGRPSTR